MRAFRVLVILVAAMAAVAFVGLSFPGVGVLAQGNGQGNGHGPPAASQQGATASNQNDAGSGADAGDAPDVALTISNAQRTWSANLTPAGADSDWYHLTESSAYCAVGSVTTQSPGALALSATTSVTHAARRPADPHDPTRLALAAPGGTSPFLGILPPSTTFMAAEEGNGPPTPGRYTFSFSSRTYAQLDPEADGETPDAGATSATSAPLPDDCAAGRIASLADAEDRYHFDVDGVRDMTFSFAVASGDAAQLTVLTPTGATFATIAPGGVTDVWADQTGRWTVVVSHASSTSASARDALSPFLRSVTEETSYIIGITDGPDPTPCRPSCYG